MKSFKDWTGFKNIKNVQGSYDFGSEMGRGSLGVVRAAKSRRGKFSCVVKVIHKKVVGQNFETVESQLKVLEDCSNPFISKIFELRSDEKNLYIVQEQLVHGQLLPYLSTQKSITEGDIRTIALQLFQALNFLHCSHITHGNVKPENILISNVDPLQIKLTDYGFESVF